MTGKNNFDQRGDELMPRELMERAVSNSRAASSRRSDP